MMRRLAVLSDIQLAVLISEAMVERDWMMVRGEDYREEEEQKLTEIDKSDSFCLYCRSRLELHHRSLVRRS